MSVYRTLGFIPALEKLEEVKNQLKGHRIEVDPRRKLVVVAYLTGLWAKAEDATIAVLAEIRSRRDWNQAKRLVVPTEHTIGLIRIMERAFPAKKPYRQKGKMWYSLGPI